MRTMRYLLMLLVFACWQLAAGNITITFEDLAENDIVSDQYAWRDVMVSGPLGMNPVIFTAGSMLNEIDFPPHSGTNVLVDLGGPILFTFTPFGAYSVGAYFTYTTQLTMEIFSKTGLPLGTKMSALSENLGTSEWIDFAFPTPDIGALLVTGLDTGSSFTMDDLTFNAVPEPVTILLVSGGLFLVGMWRRKVRR